MLNKNQRNREFIRYAAFVMLAIRYQGTDNSIEPLRKHLLGPILLPPTGLISVQAPTVATSQGPGVSNHESEPVTPTQEALPETALEPVTPARSSHQSNEISTPASRHCPTKMLAEGQNKRRSLQTGGRQFVSRPLVQRVKQQNNSFLKMAQDVHYGTKEDLLVGISLAASSRNKSSSHTSDSWDGSLTPQDIVTLAKLTHDSSTKKSVYETLTTDHATELNHISSLEIVQMQDSVSQKEVFRNLRRRLPRYFASERQTEKLRNKWHKEFEIVLQPSRTTTGWRINPERLHQCVSVAHPWMRELDSEWWRLYGDARNFGGQKSVLISLTNINNEAMFNGYSFHSPEENCWPVHIFYGPDSRLNLQLNIGGESGYLNNWIDSMSEKGHKTFVASDNMFANALLGGGLDPKSSDNFSLYTFETTATRSEVGKQTGLRSELNRQIVREHPDSLLPAIPTDHFIPCANHMFARITEHLLTLRIMSCLNEGVVNNDKNSTLTKLISNINMRGVRGGNFEIRFDGPKLEPISLNVTHAETISAPPEAFTSTFPDILDGVADEKPFAQALPLHLKEALSWPSCTISSYDLEKSIWETHWKMHVICRKDPDPRTSEPHLLPGSTAGSNCASDYRFGLLESEIEEYKRLADLHHGLMLLRYGSSRLYPYLMTRVDIVPILLKELPFHSLFRGSTEGGEHCHYLHQCLYYAHSARGGGWRKEEPILSLFKWTYRRLRQKIEMGNQHVKDEFQNFLSKCCEEAGRNFEEEFGEHPQPVSTETANSSAPSVLADTDRPPTDDIPEQAKNLQSEMPDQLNQTNTPSSRDNKTGTHVISLFDELK